MSTLDEITREKAEQFIDLFASRKGEVFQDSNEVTVILDLSNSDSLIVKFNFKNGEKSYFIDTSGKRNSQNTK